jgi:hypothetical protein
VSFLFIAWIEVSASAPRNQRRRCDTACITLVAAGGTAMTLLDVKPSTIDVDFTVPACDLRIFKKALAITPHGFKIDTWPDGFVFSQQLPDDYLNHSIEIISLGHIVLNALHHIDIVVTKNGRLNKKDMEDIEACITKFQLSKPQIETRAAGLIYMEDETLYQANLEYVRQNYFLGDKPLT